MCVCVGVAIVGTGDAQCGATLFVILLFLVVYIHFSHKQRVGAELLIAREDLKNVRAQQTLTMETQRQQGPIAYRLDCRISKTAFSPNLRQRIYEVAEKHHAFSAEIAYTSRNSEAELAVSLAFASYNGAVSMLHKIRHLTSKNPSFTPGIVHEIRETDEKPTPGNFVIAGHHDPQRTPDSDSIRAAADVASELSSFSNPSINDELLLYEYVLDVEQARKWGHLPVWCHMLETSECRRNNYEDPSQTNRIILPRALRELYGDFRHKNQDANQPSLSFWGEEGQHLANGRTVVQMKAVFSCCQLAESWSVLLRHSTYETGSRVVDFTIEHERANEFLLFLNTRHEQQVKRQPLLGVPDETRMDPSVKMPTQTQRAVLTSASLTVGIASIGTQHSC